MPDVSQHKRLEEGFVARSERALRSLQNEVPTSGQARQRGLRAVPRGWRFQEAAAFPEMHGLPQRRAHRSICEAGGWWRVRLLPQRAGLEAISICDERT